MSISRLLIEVTTLTRKTKQDRSSQRQSLSDFFKLVCLCANSELRKQLDHQPRELEKRPDRTTQA